MARVQAITSEDLVYQIQLTRGTPRREALPVWAGSTTIPGRPGQPPTVRPFEPRSVDKVSSGRMEFTTTEVQWTDRDVLTYNYSLICYDFRTNNEGRTDDSGRPQQRMNNVKRIQSAELTFQVSGIATRREEFYIACLPKINISRSLPVVTELGMNYFLGYNEIYSDRLGRPVTRDGSTGGNINPACFAGSEVLLQPALGRPDRSSGTVVPITLVDTDSYPATVTVKLRPRMLRALESAMRDGTVFGLAVVPTYGFGLGLEQFTADGGKNFWGDRSAGPPRSTITTGLKVRSGLNASYDPPKLAYRYALDNNKINTGAGISRTSTSGFMEGNVFAGTNSGFSE